MVISTCALATENINIQEINFIGDIEYLNDDSKAELVKIANTLEGKKYSENDILNAEKNMVNMLKEKSDLNYKINVHYLDDKNGYVVFYLSYINGIVYKDTEGYSKENIKNSLPSLQQNIAYEDSRQWFDPRELNMAQENPLKMTMLHYDLDPENKSSTLTVFPYAPYGNRYNYVAVDNYGSRKLNYARVTLGHMNANLTGHDDVLSLNALSSIKRPNDSYAFSLSYLYPFYAQHQTLGINLSYSHTNSDETDGLVTGLDRKTARGNLLNAGLNWSYYLPSFDLGVKDQFKINAGYLYRYYDQHSSILANQGASSLDNGFRFGLGGISLGFSGEIKPTSDSEIRFSVTQSYYSDKLPGAQNTGSLKTYNYARRYMLTNYSLSYSHEISKWTFKTALEGQYTSSHIPSLDYLSITGIYNVRGFKYNGLSADKGLVWRSELSTPAYTSFNLKNYAFYDWGRFNYNDSNRNDHSISSAGLGLRGEIVKGLNFDVFVARRLHNAKLDALDDGTTSDKTSVWGKISYGF